MAISEPQRLDWYEWTFALRRQTANGPVLYADLKKAVRLLSPRLVLEPNQSELFGISIPDPPERVGDTAWIRLESPERGNPAELIDWLVEQPQPLVLIALATSELRDTIGVASDAGMISVDYDHLDASVPSIEPHDQNEHRSGVIGLTELIARLLSSVSATDPEAGRRYAEQWRAMPGRVGRRLWMHALRDPHLYDATAAIRGLRYLSIDDFWTALREPALVIKERAAQADPAVVGALERRVRKEAWRYYQRYHVEDGQADWRDYARDQEVWFRLKMLEAAGVLSGRGSEELTAIVSRHPNLDREVEERDFFRSYSFGVRAVVGDATDIADAPEDDRLRIAQESLVSHDIETQRGWSAFCHASPAGALEVLRGEPLDEANAQLWSDLVSVLAHDHALSDYARDRLTRSVFELLQAASGEFLVSIIPNLADLFCNSPQQTRTGIAAWWPRLFLAATKAENDTEEEDLDIVNRR